MQDGVQETVPEAAREQVRQAVQAFAGRADISARSVLVTIFGDSIVPAGGEIWLADLIALCEPFGFSDRLVRTSMFRLGSEGWFETERVGRHSRYRLTRTATTQFAAAEARIYHRPTVPWDGRWTLAFLDAADRTVRDGVAAALRWRGFATLSPGVLALPRAGGAAVVEEVAAEAGVVVPVALSLLRGPRGAGGVGVAGTGRWGSTSRRNGTVRSWRDTVGYGPCAGRPWPTTRRSCCAPCWCTTTAGPASPTPTCPPPCCPTTGRPPTPTAWPPLPTTWYRRERGAACTPAPV
ncbi:MAG: hypothetical protein R2749_17080 [Acidimicrobiales bacterium]